MSTALELVLFGQPRLLAGGRDLRLRVRKSHALCALLAMDGATPRERLATWLWPAVAPSQARANLRREVFRLRELGLELGDAGDDRLALPDGLPVDLQRFEAALAARDDAQAFALLGSTPLQGLDGVGGDAFDDWLAALRERVLRQAVALATRRARALEAGGDFDAALAVYQGLLAADATAEPAAAAVMGLLAQRGDRAGALATFERLSAALRECLALDPLPQTRSLAERLRGSAGLKPAASIGSVPAPQARPSLPARAPFVARPLLEAAVDQGWRAGQRVYVSGPPGAGKTRLASACAAARGPWLRIACEAPDAQQPYASAVRGLRAAIEAAPDVTWPPWVRRELALLLPEWANGATPTEPTPDAHQRLLAAFRAAWQLLVADNFAAVMVDDWQHGDSASLALWDTVDTASVPWILVHRQGQLRTEALARQRRDIDAGRAVRVAVEGMSDEEVLTLVRSLSGSTRGLLFARRLHVATAGNPFFVLETIRHLFERGLLAMDAAGGWSTPFDDSTADYTELPVPSTVRDAVLARVHMLGASGRRLLEVASLAGDPFDAAALAASAALDEEGAVASLEHATAAQLIEPEGTGYRFAHDLVRQCVADSLSPARRQRLHGQLARQLQAQRGAPAQIAAHLEAAGQVHAALPWRRAAAEAARRVHAIDDAIAQYRLALQCQPLPVEAARLQLALAPLLMQRAVPTDAEAALTAAAEAAQQPDVDDETRIDAWLARAAHWCSCDRIQDAVVLLEQVDLARATVLQRSRAQLIRGQGLVLLGRASEADRCLDEALRLLGDGISLQRAQLLDERARALARRGDLDGGGRAIDQAVRVFEALADRPGLAQALTLQGVVALFKGERAAALAVLERARGIAASCGHVPAQRAAILNLSKLYNDLGETARAVALLDEGEALAPVFEHGRAQQAFLEARFWVHYLRGEAAAAAAAAARLLAHAGAIGDVHARIGAHQLVVDFYLHMGELAQARQVLDAALALCGAGDDGGGGERPVILAKTAWLRVSEGAPAAALNLLRSLGEVPRLQDRFVIAFVGAAASRALGDTTGARHWLASVDITVDTATESLAMVLTERLQLAASSGAGDEAARARALALFAAGQVPAFEGRHLRQALGLAPEPFDTTRPA